MDHIVTLDPPAVATARTPLELNQGPIRIESAGIDWGDGAISAYMADMRVGSSPVDYRIPNRIVTIPLGLGMDDSSFIAARRQLTEKVALLQREGGWLQRGDTGWYADVVNATLTLPDRYGEGGGVEVDVKLVLECLPDFYGDEITLDAVTGTGQIHTVLEQSGAPAVIAGDHPARCRIVVTDASGNDQHGLLWGVRSRHYDPATTAGLFYEGEALTPLDAAATFAHAGASGGSTMRHNSLPGGSWCPVLLTDLLAGSAGLTHRGSYRIRARVYSATATPQLRLLWGVGDVSNPITNQMVQVPGAGAFYLVDLGAVRLDAPPTGNYDWHGVIQALAAVQDDPIEIDCLYLIPLDEYAGGLEASQVASTFGITATEFAGAGADDGSVGALAWSDPGNITSEDAAVASADPVGGTGVVTHYLTSSAHGFGIPTGATISGIRVDIKRADVADVTLDQAVHLVKAGVVQTPNKADTLTPWPLGLTWKSYGGATDLWGGAWTPADINDAAFGATLSANLTRKFCRAHVDAIRIAVFYTTAGGFTTSKDAVVYANHSAELRTEGMFRQDSTGTVEGRAAIVRGDLPRLPPSGLEARPVELFVKASRGNLAELADGGLDASTAQATYWPCFLFGPT